jgi:ABC-type Fe3+ transport system permease subunit
MFESLRYGISNWGNVSNLAILQCLISLSVGLVLIRRMKGPYEITDRILSRPNTEARAAKRLSLFLICLLGLPYCIAIFKGAAHIGSVLPHLNSFLQSLGLAISSATVAVALSIIFILGNNYRLPSLISLVSVSFLSISWIVMLSRWVDPFSNPLLLIPLIQGIIFFPFAFYILWPLKQSSQVHSLLAARALGTGLVRSFLWIEGGRWKNAILSTWLMIAGLSLGEMTTISFFSLQEPLPLILKIRDLKAHYEFDAASGLLSGLLVSVLILFLVGEYLIKERD